MVPLHFIWLGVSPSLNCLQSKTLVRESFNEAENIGPKNKNDENLLLVDKFLQSPNPGRSVAVLPTLMKENKTSTEA